MAHSTRRQRFSAQYYRVPHLLSRLVIVNAPIPDSCGCNCTPVTKPLQVCGGLPATRLIDHKVPGSTVPALGYLETAVYANHGRHEASQLVAQLVQESGVHSA